MAGKLQFGPRLSDKEYSDAIVALQESVPAMPSREQEKEIRKAQLNLAIDFRLGKEFPDHRREALWHIQQDVEKGRLKAALKSLFRRWAGKPTANLEGSGLKNLLIQAYARELDAEELSVFFDLERK